MSTADKPTTAEERADRGKVCTEVLGRKESDGLDLWHCEFIVRLIADLEAAERERDEAHQISIDDNEALQQVGVQLTEVEGLLREATDNSIPGTGKSWHEPPCEVCIGCRVRAYFTKRDGGKP